jgi:hypothetical protein
MEATAQQMVRQSPGCDLRASLGPMLRLSILFPALVLISGAGAASQETSLQLSALHFTPAVIDTSDGPAKVAIQFTITAASAGAVYFEISFADPLGTVAQRASVSFAPAHATTSSVSITFPVLSAPGNWKVADVFTSDADGNTLTLDTPAITAAGFPANLQVTSKGHDTPPKLDAIWLEPRSLDTRSGPADLTVNLHGTGLSPLKFFEASFRSPSGTAVQRISFDLPLKTTVTASKKLTFPRFCEAGTWTLNAVFLADLAGDTLALDEQGLAASGFSASVEVVSAQDTAPPRVAAFAFTPTVINTSGTAANVTVSFQVADDLAGATTFQVAFVSPSGHTFQNASASFAPSLSQTGTATVVFPAESEPGSWTIASVFLADAAGNTASLTADNLTGSGFPSRLTVTKGPSAAREQ